jgi:hypothetical protein
LEHSVEIGGKTHFAKRANFSSFYGRYPSLAAALPPPENFGSMPMGGLFQRADGDFEFDDLSFISKLVAWGILTQQE